MNAREANGAAEVSGPAVSDPGSRPMPQAIPRWRSTSAASATSS